LQARSTAVVALFAAVAGGLVVLVAALALGRFHGKTTTVVLQQPAPASNGAPVAVAKPLAGNEFRPAALYRLRAAGVVTILSTFGGVSGAAQGSGFVVGADGTVLTSAHVVTTAGDGTGARQRARAVFVVFSDGDRVPATLAGVDYFDDVGVLRVDPALHGLRPVPLGDSNAVVVGQPVAAIGSPFGNSDSLSVGVVSAVRRSIPSLTTQYNLVDAIQTDAPINHGNSGGPLFDAEGRVIGINAQIRSTDSQSGFEGVGFAVPIASAKRSLAQIVQTGTVRYAYLGIEAEDLSPAIAKRFGYATSHGALIDLVRAGSPAATAGLEAGTNHTVFRGQPITVGGDAIVSIDGVPVRSAADVVRVVSERLYPGQVVRIAVVRGSARRVVHTRLAERPLQG
jgi:2-alkenal reductase